MKPTRKLIQEGKFVEIFEYINSYPKIFDDYYTEEAAEIIREECQIYKFNRREYISLKDIKRLEKRKSTNRQKRK